MKITRHLICFAVMVVVLAVQRHASTSAEEFNPFKRGAEYDTLDKIAQLYADEDPKKRITAFQYYHGLRKFVREMHLNMIDRRIDNYDHELKLEELNILSPQKALAIAMQADNDPDYTIRCLLKNIEYQADKVSTLAFGNFYQPDRKYPTYVCIPVLRGYGGAITESTVQFLTLTSKDHVSDKQIELIGYLLHQRYGSGQAAVRIITVLAEEATKAPHAPNVVRLINHLGSTYKP